MNYFLKQQLEILAEEADIQEKSAQRQKAAIRAILMFEVGAAYYDYTHTNETSTEPPQIHSNNKYSRAIENG